MRGGPMNLAEKVCVPCRGDVPPLPAERAESLLAGLDGWEIINNHHLHKRYALPDFVEALAWVNCIGAIAEEQQHHPDIRLAWGSVDIEIWTHKVDGLTENDFILAAKIDGAR